jgi:hypothetical protein
MTKDIGGWDETVILSRGETTWAAIEDLQDLFELLKGLNDLTPENPAQLSDEKGIYKIYRVDAPSQDGDSFRSIAWDAVRIGDVVFIDNYEAGKYPLANPKTSGPFEVAKGNGCGRCLKCLVGPAKGCVFMHYPNNLLMKVAKS